MACSHASGARRPWHLLLLGLIGLAAGCSPAGLAFLMLPFVDDKVPAKFKLSSPDKEVSVAIVTWFGSLEVRPEVMPADGELSDRLGKKLRECFAYNKEKVKIIPSAQVRS